jgi:hypothetical protein
VGREVILDYLLYRIDRAIDFYAVGYRSEGQSEPELRAAALGYVLNHALPILNEGERGAQAINPMLHNGLSAVHAQLTPAEPPTAAQVPMVVDELNGQYYAEQQLETLVQSLSLRCYANGFFSTEGHRSRVCGLIFAAIRELGAELSPPGSIVIPPDMSSSLAAIAHNWPLRRQGV